MSAVNSKGRKATKPKGPRYYRVSVWFHSKSDISLVRRAAAKMRRKLSPYIAEAVLKQAKLDESVEP